MEPISHVDLTTAEKIFGSPAWAVHRVGLRKELLRIATSAAETGTPIRINWSSEVADASPNEGSITLQNGEKHVADLVVAADDTDILENDERLSLILKKKGPGAALLAEAKDFINERHIMWYPCEDGRVQNFVGIHWRTEVDGEEDKPESIKASMLEEYKHISPDIVEIIARSSQVKRWPLFAHNRLQSWTVGRLILIGDAAHPMLPFGCQGSNQAIEDGGALGFLFNGIENADGITKRLELFEQARKNRISRVQILSKVRAGKEEEVVEELRRYADPPVQVNLSSI